jgi:dTDP-4-amino-4,6-dideoxygalactose transaminase
VVIPVDLDLATLKPKAEDILNAITPNTKIVFAAHMYGAKFDLEYIS